MSDQPPPTGAPSAGDHPTMPTTPPTSETTPPVTAPAPPYPTPPYAGGPYPGSQHPAAPYPNPQYSGAQYPNPPYPGAQAPSNGYYTGTYAPAGYAGGYSPSPASAPKKPGGLGLVALLLSLAAAVVAPIVGAIAAFQIGSGTWSWSSLETMDENSFADLSFLSPVREWVLLGEIAFWGGTVLGIWAIVQGIVAIAKRRGLGTGIAAIVVAVLAIFIFGTVVYAAALAGIGTGMGTGTGLGA